MSAAESVAVIVVAILTVVVAPILAYHILKWKKRAGLLSGPAVAALNEMPGYSKVSTVGRQPTQDDAVIHLAHAVSEITTRLRSTERYMIGDLIPWGDRGWARAEEPREPMPEPPPDVFAP